MLLLVYIQTLYNKSSAVEQRTMNCLPAMELRRSVLFSIACMAVNRFVPVTTISPSDASSSVMSEIEGKYKLV